jgi:hypothetical protein
MESKCNGECLLMTSVKHELSISVGLNTFKTKGILVFSRKGVFKHVWTQIFHYALLFLSLG